MLSKEKIIELLETLHEHTMARDIFVPVFKKMGLNGVKYTGGQAEEGIDIEYCEFTMPENRKSYVGVQFKKGNLTYGAGGDKNTVKEVRNQAEEAFDKDIVDIDGHSTVKISRFVVAATGDINEPARKYIGKARLSGVHRGIDYWTGDRLAEFIQKNWMSEFEDYFRAQLADVSDEHNEPKEVIVDAEYISENCADEVAKCRSLRATVSGTEWDICRAVIEQTCFQGDGTWAKIPDLLLSMECRESALQSQFEHLAYLEFLEFEGNSLRLNGHANDLSALARGIVRELMDAEEDVDQAGTLFDLVTSRDKHRL